MFSLWSLVKASVLMTNALAILHRGRFLKPMGLAESDPSLGAAAPKNQAVGLLQAVTYLKGPLIAMNTIIILVELLFGG